MLGINLPPSHLHSISKLFSMLCETCRGFLKTIFHNCIDPFLQPVGMMFVDVGNVGGVKSYIIVARMAAIIMVT